MRKFNGIYFRRLEEGETLVVVRSGCAIAFPSHIARKKPISSHLPFQ
ncbi:MAG: hypothetical protein KFF72_19500 [Arthrospira sp. SH-MAG29]|nr:hypothetical protein [Arthrospira sp. SH-MAG29]MBS0018503.1 hypothetical protein [Arthrospira sp. SH-MAG29]